MRATVYRVTVACFGVPESEGAAAAARVALDFADHRTEFSAVACSFRDGVLELEAESDFDLDGSYLRDALFDSVAAHVPTAFDGELHVTRIEPREGPA